jgi:hypothetical protein
MDVVRIGAVVRATAIVEFPVSVQVSTHDDRVAELRSRHRNLESCGARLRNEAAARSGVCPSCTFSPPPPRAGKSHRSHAVTVRCPAQATSVVLDKLWARARAAERSSRATMIAKRAGISRENAAGCFAFGRLMFVSLETSGAPI